MRVILAAIFALLFTANQLYAANLDTVGEKILQLGQEATAAAKAKNSILEGQRDVEVWATICSLHQAPVQSSTWVVSKLTFNAILFQSHYKQERAAWLVVDYSSDLAREGGYLNALAQIKAGDKVPFSGRIEVEHPAVCEMRTTNYNARMFLRDAVFDLSKYGGSKRQPISPEPDFSGQASETKKQLCLADATQFEADRVAQQGAADQAQSLRFDRKGRTILTYSTVPRGGPALEYLSRAEADELLLRPRSRTVRLVTKPEEVGKTGRCVYEFELTSGRYRAVAKVNISIEVDAKAGTQNIRHRLGIEKYQLLPN